MPPHTQIPYLPNGSRCRLLVALAVTLSVLLPLAAPRVHAQDEEVWDGEVEVDTNSVEVPVGDPPSTASG